MPSELPLGEPGHELLLREMGRINSELAAQRRHSAMTLHDLAAPAQVVLGLSETLLEHPGLDPFVRGRLEQLHRSAESLRGLLAELNRGFALDDASQLSLQRLEVFDLVSSLVERTRLLADAKGITLLLLVEQSDARGCWVDADGLKLERALSNLLGNAIKFSPADSTVSIAVDRGVDHAKVAVHDEGPGISEEGQERVFEVFHREPDAEGLPGQGLGLHITRQIIESHGGQVSVRSRQGRGSTFLIELPLSLDEVYADPA